MAPMIVKFKKLHDNAKAPTYGSTGSAGADLYAVSDGEIVLLSGTTVLVHTGIAVQIPEGYVGLIFARSGLASKKGLAPANKVGVIDSDYRGEIVVALHNQTNTAQTVSAGDRIAQLVVVPCFQAAFEEADTLTDTARGASGFGSTGR